MQAARAEIRVVMYTQFCILLTHATADKHSLLSC